MFMIDALFCPCIWTQSWLTLLLVVKVYICSWGVLNAGKALQKNALMFERDSGADLGTKLKNVTQSQTRAQKSEWRV